MMFKELIPAFGLLAVVESGRRIEVPTFDSDVVIYPKGVHCQAYFKEDYGSPKKVDDYFYQACTVCPNGKGGDVDRAWNSYCKSYNEWKFEAVENGRCTMIPGVMKDWGCQVWCRTTTQWDYGCGCGNGTDCLDVDCEMSEWSDWSDCVRWDSNQKKTVKIDCDADAPLVKGHHTRTRSVTVEKEYGGADCPADTEKRDCDSHTCVDIDCAVSEWSEWSTCTKGCGGGTRTRSRTITQQPQDNGAACPALSDTTSCNTEACYWFKLKGKSGSEEVLVVEAEMKNPSDSDGATYTLSKSAWTEIGTNSYKVTIKFKNDNSSRDVTFKYAKSPSGDQSGGFQPVLVNKWDDWKCDDNEKQNKRCERVRNGYFQWNGVYGVVFIPKN